MRASAASAAAPSHPLQPATSRPRTLSTCSDAWASTPASTSNGRWTRRGGSSSTWAMPYRACSSRRATFPAHARRARSNNGRRKTTMTIKAGDRIPEGKLKIMGADGPVNVTAAELLGKGRVVLFSVPGAFTPTCNAKHLPGFVEKAAALKGKGIGKIVCMAVNDVFVMNAWGKSAGVGDAIVMAADGNGDYARALGLELDARGFGMGMRGQRFALVIEDGVVRQVHVE